MARTLRRCEAHDNWHLPHLASHHWYLVVTDRPGGQHAEHLHTTRGAWHAVAEPGRLDHQDVAAQLIQNALGRVADQQALETRARYRAHDHYRAAASTGCRGDATDRVTCQQIAT